MPARPGSSWKSANMPAASCSLPREASSMPWAARIRRTQLRPSSSCPPISQNRRSPIAIRAAGPGVLAGAGAPFEAGAQVGIVGLDPGEQRRRLRPLEPRLDGARARRPAGGPGRTGQSPPLPSGPAAPEAYSAPRPAVGTRCRRRAPCVAAARCPPRPRARSARPGRRPEPLRCPRSPGRPPPRVAPAVAAGRR